MKRLLLLTSLLLLANVAFANHGMSQASLERIIKAMADSSRGEQGVVEFDFNNVRMYVISDVKHNRMRIVAPVAEYAKLTRAQLDAMGVTFAPIDEGLLAAMQEAADGIAQEWSDTVQSRYDIDGIALIEATRARIAEVSSN